ARKRHDAGALKPLRRHFMANTIDLAGRVAVVTGGAQGIGRAIVERFLASGAAVAIWDQNAALAKETAGVLKTHGRVGPSDVHITALAAVERARDDPLAAFSHTAILF